MNKPDYGETPEYRKPQTPAIKNGTISRRNNRSKRQRGKIRSLAGASDRSTSKVRQVQVFNRSHAGVSLTRLQYDPQGVQLVGLRGAALTIWNTATFDETPVPPKTITVPADQIDACVFSRDGSQLAVGGTEDSAVWIYKAATGQLLKRLDAKP